MMPSTRKYINTVLNPLNSRLVAPAECLADAFRWRYTREGHDYWNSVCYRLDALMRDEFITDAIPVLLEQFEDITLVRMPTNGTKEAFANLVDFLVVGFQWKHTVEGEEFWGDVLQRVVQKRDRLETMFLMDGIIAYLMSEEPK